MGVDFQGVAATAGWPTLYDAAERIVNDSIGPFSSLLHAVVRTTEEVALDLLGKGANANEVGSDNTTLLHVAVLCAGVESVKGIRHCGPLAGLGHAF
jgi:hypothetical protein